RARGNSRHTSWFVCAGHAINDGAIPFARAIVTVPSAIQGIESASSEGGVGTPINIIPTARRIRVGDTRVGRFDRHGSGKAKEDQSWSEGSFHTFAWIVG